jgi:hypothetical protein
MESSLQILIRSKNQGFPRPSSPWRTSGEAPLDSSASGGLTRGKHVNTKEHKVSYVCETVFFVCIGSR